LRRCGSVGLDDTGTVQRKKRFDLDACTIGRSNAAAPTGNWRLYGCRGFEITANSFFFDVGGPGYFEALLDALVDGAVVFVIGQGAIGFGFFPFGDFEVIAQFYGGDTEHFAVGFNASFDVRFEVICCRDSTRFQRAGKCAGQSTS
jgi:hypothetical protein